MKKILVPLNFSPVSANALEYAVEMAKLMKAELILLHVIHVPVAPIEELITTPVFYDLEIECLQNLRTERAKIYQNHGRSLKIQCHCREGYVVDQINGFAREKQVDLIVLGMKSAGLIDEMLGRVTGPLLRNAWCPVLSIDMNVRFRPIRRILLASDFKETESDILSLLKTLIRQLDARLYIVNVVPEPDPVLTVDEAANKLMLAHALEGCDFTFFDTRHVDVVEGINHFVHTHRIDMVATVPHKQSLFGAIFWESVTENVADHLSVPVLALHEIKHNSSSI